MKQTIPSILYLHSSADLYGSDYCLINIIKAASKIHKCIIVLPYKGPLAKYFEGHKNVKVYLYDFGILRRQYFNFRGIFKYCYHLLSGIIFLLYIIIKEKIIIIHTNTSAIITGGIISCISGKKHIWHVREIIFKPRKFSRCLNTMIILFSTEIIAISHSVKKNILANSYLKKDKKIKVIFDGINYQKSERNRTIRKSLLKNYKIQSDEFVVGMVGRINPLKGQDILIRAAKIVIERNIKIKFFIVGDPFQGYEGLLLNLQEKVQQLGLANDVFFTGFIKDKSSIYNLFDIFVHPATAPEGLGLVILEAMANGLPVIASSCGGPKEIIVNGVTGLLVTPGSPEELAESIIYLQKHKALRIKLGDTALSEVSHRFSINKTMAQTMQLYEDVIANE